MSDTDGTAGTAPGTDGDAGVVAPTSQTAGNEGSAPAPGTGGGNGNDQGARIVDLESQLAHARDIQRGYDRRIAALERDLGAVQSERDAARGQLTDFEQRVPTLEARLGDFDSRLTEVQARAERAEIVAREYPELAPFLDIEGGLPAFTDADAFREKANLVRDTAKSIAAGQTPPAKPPVGAPPPGSPQAGGQLPSREEAWVAVQAAITGGGKTAAEIDELMNKYYQVAVQPPG